ncbi:hypothetical protein LEMLEM_LOCUS16563 [Lemmus lemmus]
MQENAKGLRVLHHQRKNDVYTKAFLGKIEENESPCPLVVGYRLKNDTPTRKKLTVLL